MTPEEQRIAIAEMCGAKWTKFPDGVHVVLSFKTSQSEIGGNIYLGDERVMGYDIPDYINDLNATFDAEKMLNHDQWRIYLGFLMGNRVIPKLASMEEFHKAWCAPAAQRVEAFLKAVGKWKG